MTTLAANQERDYRDSLINHHPVIASDIIYAGAAVGDNGSGYARPLAGGDPFLGFALEKVDNSAGSAGDLNVEVRRKGIICNLPVTGVVITSVGADVHASDDNTFTLTAGSTTRIGRVVRYVSNGYADVEFESVEGTEALLTDSTGGTANDTLAQVADIALSTSNTYTDAAVNAAVNTAIATINDDLADLAAKVNHLLRQQGS